MAGDRRRRRDAQQLAAAHPADVGSSPAGGARQRPGCAPSLSEGHSALIASTRSECVLFQCVATAVEPATERGSAPAPGRPHHGLGRPARHLPLGPDRRPPLHGRCRGERHPRDPVTSRAPARIYVLHVGTLDRPWLDPKRPYDVMVQAYWDRPTPPVPRGSRCCGVGQGDRPAVGSPAPAEITNSSHSDELITQAYAVTTAHLDAAARRGAGGRSPARAPGPGTPRPRSPPLGHDPAATPASTG